MSEFKYAVPYPSDHLSQDASELKQRIIKRFENDYQAAVDNAKERSKRNFLARLWISDGWERAVEIKRSFEYKMARIHELEDAALVGPFVSISDDYLKWINKHFEQDWCW